jgi:carbohydrate-binding DOMON domain-containing protein
MRMRLHGLRRAALPAFVLAVSATAALAQSVSFKDPTGDDNGPGGYSYPTDAVYRKGRST